jgi:hypothetical protein
MNCLIRFLRTAIISPLLSLSSPFSLRAAQLPPDPLPLLSGGLAAGDDGGEEAGLLCIAVAIVVV